MNPCLAVVIPCFKVKSHILDVIRKIGGEVSFIFVIDDFCPQETGKFVESECTDPRVKVIYHHENQGVGGATMSGYIAALQKGVDIIVKLDGDGQMDPGLIPYIVAPIISGRADYAKGNRFFDIAYLSGMPRIRLFGNSILSLVSKITSGYWDIMDPTNGFTAIQGRVLKHIPLEKLEKGYFFESDMLFRLGTIRAVVCDVPMESVYSNEESGLNTCSIALEFPGKYFSRFIKRIFYSYFLRDFNAGTVALVFSSIFTFSGIIYGFWHWYIAFVTGIPALTGVIMLATLLLIIGFQLLLSVINFDIANTPKNPIHHSLPESLMTKHAEVKRE